MTRYLLPAAFVSLLAFAGQDAWAFHPTPWAVRATALPSHHHHHFSFPSGGVGLAPAAPSAVGFANRTGFGNGFGAGNGFANGFGNGFSSPFNPFAGYPPYYGGFGYGNPGFPPQGYVYPNSYFASPGYGQWGGFGPGF